MPELPEVETIRRQLSGELVGRRISRLSVLDPRWSRPRPPAEIERGCAGRPIGAVRRRGKYLIVDLEPELSLVMHLRMTGNLLLSRRAPRERPSGSGTGALNGRPRHLRAVLELDDGSEVRFTDPRRFGHGTLLRAGELERYLGERLGVEPLSQGLTEEAILALAAPRRAPLKSFLLDQRAIAGIGNIYADEALHRAGLHPLSPAGSVRPRHAEALRFGIVAALEAGLANGGASMDDYRDSRGDRGTMQDELRVHTREGLPCRGCERPIRRIVVAGRSTYFCASCQRRLRG